MPAPSPDLSRLVESTPLDGLDDEPMTTRLGWLFWIAAAWLALVIGAAVLAPWLPLADYRTQFARSGRLPPSAEHWLGTDSLGRDLLSRVIWGARVSLVVGLASVVLGVVVGGTIGLLAGYSKGIVERVLMWSMDVVLAFPALLLSLAIITFSGQRTELVIALAIGVVAIPPLARLVRASTLVNREKDYVQAARVTGASDLRIMVKEILPNVARPVSSFAIIGVAVAIVAEGGLAFLGLSVPPPTPTWGTMINDGRASLDTAPWITLVPCAVLFLTVLALNLAGDRLREHVDGKDGGR